MGLSSEFEHILELRKQSGVGIMDGQKKNTIALIIAMMIIASSIYNV